ncbi:hypothetical protein [Lactobacillus sp. HT06-2]|uniref:hypothetical protein n=1 Tax=Lactobacillus sp. HT06-2 TaxID=2080222 RepID=UPI000CD82E59|nr:hypothetical protein [Lactobacillus sp. HT06-2]
MKTNNQNTEVKKLYIWQDYVTSNDELITTGIGAVDQTGKIIFDELVKPETKWLKDETNAERWLEIANHAGYSASEIVLARPLSIVSNKLSHQISKLTGVTTLVSYNVRHNIPESLRHKYEEVDTMDLFADVIKEPLYASDLAHGTDTDDKGEIIGYKWQKFSKYLDHYHVKLKGNKACDYADAIRKAHQKMSE